MLQKRIQQQLSRKAVRGPVSFCMCLCADNPALKTACCSIIFKPDGQITLFSITKAHLVPKRFKKALQPYLTGADFAGNPFWLKKYRHEKRD
jgi:tRNA-binding EMAP/Myf-like protein